MTDLCRLGLASILRLPTMARSGERERATSPLAMDSSIPLGELAWMDDDDAMPGGQMGGAQTLSDASRIDAESAATLESLETWLRIRDPRQFDANTARDSLNCAGCHDRRDPHIKRFGNDCAQCHALDSWIVVDYQHPSSQSKECVQCHQPPPSHSMGHFSMVSRKFAGKEHALVEQCFECHNTTSWNDIVGVGFYKHH